MDKIDEIMKAAMAWTESARSCCAAALTRKSVTAQLAGNAAG
jgi:hypothetical protein